MFFSIAIPLIATRTVGCSANVMSGSVIAPDSLISVVISGGLIPTASAAPANANSEPEPIWFGTYTFADSPNTEIVPNGCSENVRISGAVEPDRRISVPSSGGFAMNASVDAPKNLMSAWNSGRSIVLDSAVPLNANRPPEPANPRALGVSATPLILRSTSGCSANVRSSEDPPKEKRLPSPVYRP